MTTFVERHFGKILAGLWLLELALLFFFARDAIVQWKVGDPDDQLRIVQVRDWLAGQSWSDVHQYRMNPPSGGDMHWSRLVDIPLALAMLILQPFVGEAEAEFWAAIIIPMLTLGIFLYCYAQLVRRHFGSAAALVSTAGLLTAVPVIMQLLPLRVDHHGWQLVCMVLCIRFLLDQERPVRSAILLGVISAIWLEISIEAFPNVVSFIAVMGFRWLFGTASQAEKPLFCQFNLLTVATALASGLLLLTMKSATSLSQAPCDALSSAHVSAFMACAGVSTATLLALQLTNVRPGFWIKLIICAVAALAALAVLNIGAPQCLGDSFGNLDPVVRRYWFDRVAEGLPIFRLSLHEIISAAVILLAGLLGLFYLVRFNTKVSAETKTALTLTFLVTALVSVYVSRTQVYFIIIVSMVLAPLTATVFASITDEQSLTRRMASRVLAMALLAPFLGGQLVADIIEHVTTTAAETRSLGIKLDEKTAKLCENSSSIEKLRRLPRSIILAGLDFTPGLLQHTEHIGIASGHHRNQEAMRDVILAFTSTPDVLASVLKRRGVDFVVVCPAAPEFVLYIIRNPEGNWSRLNKGEQFDMLVEQPDVGPYRVWRVRK